MKPDWTVTTADGVPIGAKVTEPAGPCRGDVLLLHAMMVDARCLDRPYRAGLATALSEKGFRVHRADFRGRGMSGKPDDWTYDDLVYRDLPAMVAGAGGRPWVVGHSLGGHVTAASWGTGSVDLTGLVGLGANCWMPSLESSRSVRMKKALGMAALKTSLRLFGKIAARRAGMGPLDEAFGYGSDLHRFWATDSWADRVGTDWLSSLATLRGPILQVVSDGDRLLAHPSGARAWAENMRAAEIWTLRDGSYGIAKAPGHMEMGIDGLCRPLWDAIGDWMTRHA